VRFLIWQILKRLWRRPFSIQAFETARLRCYPDSALAGAVIYFGYPDWNEMLFLRQILRPGDGFLDIGANIGVYSVFASTFVMPGGTILAVEPEPRNAERLVENFRLNGLPDDSVVESAVGERSGMCNFESGRDATGGVADSASGVTISVEMRKLDNIVDCPNKFVVGKMDVEGYELFALKGAQRLLEARRPCCWLIETNSADEKYGIDRAGLQNFLFSFGFQLFEIHDGGTRLNPVPQGGPFPSNSVAIADLGWLSSRSPSTRVGKALHCDNWGLDP
jgi:FkbM family methyltransferase